jgi:hypothetical protein
MDETLVYTRRAGTPDHSNYIKADVTLTPIQFDGSHLYV